jgi:hypothetical protein
MKPNLHILLLVFCRENDLELQHEFKFHPTRKWKFDYFIPGLNTAIEFEGLVSSSKGKEKGKSRHTTITGYTGDCTKYNAAVKMGIKVLRYTVLNYMDVVEDLKQLKTKK